ncbi:MAG: DUF2207 domain-containing protein [Thermoleophilia bacterium]|nr:DUF2207 domain-containing protein [Thermoleophilia bacterium]
MSGSTAARAGAQEQRRWQTFRNYLDDLAGFQALAVAQETFECYLPYAIAFGVETRSVRRFHELLVSVSPWLGPVVGPKAYRAPDLAEARNGTTSPAPGPRRRPPRRPAECAAAEPDLMSAPSRTGGSHGAFGSSRVTGGGSHRRDLMVAPATASRAARAPRETEAASPPAAGEAEAASGRDDVDEGSRLR